MNQENVDWIMAYLFALAFALVIQLMFNSWFITLGFGCYALIMLKNYFNSFKFNLEPPKKEKE